MTKKMIFKEDKYYEGKLLYQPGKPYSVPANMVDRWVRRGGVILPDDEPVEAQPAPEKVEPLQEKPEDVVNGPSDLPTTDTAPPPDKQEDKKPSGGNPQNQNRPGKNKNKYR